tara:strand:- start:1191 stop:1418 length:228 start_codon:yes stop_codon:yes gene_type:complete
MSKKILIETEKAGLYRDKSSMALINNDKAAFAQYKLKRERGRQVQTLSTEVASLKQDMVEIKTMLMTLTEGINGK